MHSCVPRCIVLLVVLLQQYWFGDQSLVLLYTHGRAGVTGWFSGAVHGLRGRTSRLHRQRVPGMQSSHCVSHTRLKHTQHTRVTLTTGCSTLCCTLDHPVSIFINDSCVQSRRLYIYALQGPGL